MPRPPLSHCTAVLLAASPRRWGSVKPRTLRTAVQQGCAISREWYSAPPSIVFYIAVGHPGTRLFLADVSSWVLLPTVVPCWTCSIELVVVSGQPSLNCWVSQPQVAIVCATATSFLNPGSEIDAAVERPVASCEWKTTRCVSWRRRSCRHVHVVGDTQVPSVIVQSSTGENEFCEFPER